MENQKLTDIRNSLSALPILQNKLSKLQNSIYEAEDEVRSLLRKFEEESLDVDKLEKDSLSTTFLKFIGKYEGKLDKETQEMLDAKLEYDKAVHRVKELKDEREELRSRISALDTDKKLFEEEVKKREELIKSKFSADAYDKYSQLESEQEALRKLSVETDEAQRAAARASSTAETVMGHLESAEKWATYDVWVKGGIFSHMAKYEHMDDAQWEFNKLSSQLKDLQKELSDIEVLDTFDIGEIDSSTRFMDFWFDNIFTDLNVRDKIREDMDKLSMLANGIGHTISDLERSKSEINTKISHIEQRKIDLAISLEVKYD